VLIYTSVCAGDFVVLRSFSYALLFGLFAAACGAAVHAAHAESWTATACGAEPQAPKADVSSVAAYNASVDKITAYQKAARTYDACMSASASKDETAISEDARVRIGHIHDAVVAAHGRIAANFTHQNEMLQAASKKLGSH